MPRGWNREPKYNPTSRNLKAINGNGIKDKRIGKIVKSIQIKLDELSDPNF